MTRHGSHLVIMRGHFGNMIKMVKRSPMALLDHQTFPDTAQLQPSVV